MVVVDDDDDLEDLVTVELVETVQHDDEAHEHGHMVVVDDETVEIHDYDDMVVIDDNDDMVDQLQCDDMVEIDEIDILVELDEMVEQVQDKVVGIQHVDELVVMVEIE